VLAPLRWLEVSLFLVLVAAILAAPASAQQWNPAWSDEFGGSGGVNSLDWAYDTGTGMNGWGNNELQNYTTSTHNVNQAGGFLGITARSNPYTSGRIKTLGKRAFGPYGKAEVRSAGPTGQGLWPAFWMLGINFPGVGWPLCGEIDILEHISNTPQMFGTLHWDNGGYTYYTAAQPVMSSFNSYHVYGVTWDANAITWYLDGASVGAASIAGSINGTNEFHRSFFMLLNLAIGGNWPGMPDGTTVFPATFSVDYVKWYQWVPARRP
jgi:beta-glucanase (GH16 family)